MSFDDSRVSFQIEEYPDQSDSTVTTVRVVACYDGVGCVYGEAYDDITGYVGAEGFSASPAYADLTFDARCDLRDKLERAAGQWGIDLDAIGIDPYDGDPRNEVADLATEFGITGCEDCPGLKEDHVSAVIDGDANRLTVDGPISWVLPILRAAHGR
jgi:hypothetical protein